MSAHPTPLSYPLLDAIHEPADLRRLSPAALPQVAREVRDCLIESVGRSGGHFSAGLGTVELTVALHYLYDTPRDTICWDVGHQCYPHKILTGRRERMATIRKRGGLSGFLKRDESEYDSFGAGHSSTSISAALGMAVANARLAAIEGTRSTRKSVAVIGDGAITAGLAYEALHHAGATSADLLVVLNDNRMSISPNVGALPAYFARLVEQHGARRDAAARDARGDSCGDDAVDAAGDIGSDDADTGQPQLPPGQLFAELGVAYHGPIDGHDLPTLLRVLGELREATGPRLVHVVTQKGHGYSPAEAEPIKYHGVTPFDPAIGIVPSGKAAPLTYTQVFGDWLCEMAERDPKLVAITPAMREGSGLVEFAKRYPDRYFDVGIAEQHAVTFAAGLAAQGLRPVVAIYSTFLQRAYDQLVHDVNLQNLPVVFAIDRAGLVGPDGATHNGGLDLTYLRCLPGLTVLAPSDGAELRNMLYTALQADGPVAIRYPRANTQLPLHDLALRKLPLGVAEVRRCGRGAAILAFGTPLHAALDAGEMLGATVVNMRSVKPLDEQLVLELARSHTLLVTVEENAVAGGAGAAVGECLAAAGVQVQLLHLGLPDRHQEHGTRDEVLADAGLDASGVFAAIEARLIALGDPRYAPQPGDAGRDVAAHGTPGGRAPRRRTVLASLFG